MAENLELGAYLLRDKAELARRRERVFALFPRLQERLDQVAGSLSGGEQQMLAVGRALMADPRHPAARRALARPRAARDRGHSRRRSARLNREGLTIVLVEQKAPLALKLARRAYLMSLGRIVAEIDPRTVTSYDEIAQLLSSLSRCGASAPALPWLVALRDARATPSSPAAIWSRSCRSR